VLTVLSSAGIPLLLLDDSVSLEEDEDFIDDEELELSSLSSLIPTSSLLLGVFVGNAMTMLQTERSPSVSMCIIALSAFSSVSSVFVVLFACVGASVGNAALSAFPVLSFVFTVPSLAVFVVCVVAAVLSTVSSRRCCKSALRPSTESPRN